eukprot:ANDGO_05185.mRNA.1 hypothetical protein
MAARHPGSVQAMTEQHPGSHLLLTMAARHSGSVQATAEQHPGSHLLLTTAEQHPGSHLLLTTVARHPGSQNVFLRCFVCRCSVHAQQRTLHHRKTLNQTQLQNTQELTGESKGSHSHSHAHVLHLVGSDLAVPKMFLLSECHSGIRRHSEQRQKRAWKPQRAV